MENHFDMNTEVSHKKIEIHMKPLVFSARDMQTDDLRDFFHFLDGYLLHGGSPRNIHNACPELRLESEVELKIVCGDKEQIIKPLTKEESEVQLLKEEALDA
jgi:hypothetical protein